MLFSARQLNSYLVLSNDLYLNQSVNRLIGEPRSQKIPSVKKCAAILRRAREALVSRNDDIIYNLGLTKWHRPWHIVPTLTNFQVPEGDYSIGIEVEYGFQSVQAASAVANVIKNWRHITMDSEGGRNGMEVTFPPTLYSKFGPTSQACRYLKLLAKNVQGLVVHSPAALIGTHVNLSFAGFRSDSSLMYNRMRRINAIIDTRNYYLYEGVERTLTNTEQNKYFGRIPYEGMNFQNNYIEFKLFNSVHDWKRLRQYVNISVALAELIRGNESIDYTSVLAALERGYNKA